MSGRQPPDSRNGRPGQETPVQVTRSSEGESTCSLPEWSSIDDLAAWLGESRKTVEWMRYVGKAPKAHKIAGRVKFRRRDIEAWADEQAESLPEPMPANVRQLKRAVGHDRRP